jgi:hypothetical protein
MELFVRLGMYMKSMSFVPYSLILLICVADSPWNVGGSDLMLAGDQTTHLVVAVQIHDRLLFSVGFCLLMARVNVLRRQLHRSTRWKSTVTRTAGLGRLLAWPRRWKKLLGAGSRSSGWELRHTPACRELMRAHCIRFSKTENILSIFLFNYYTQQNWIQILDKFSIKCALYKPIFLDTSKRVHVLEWNVQLLHSQLDDLELRDLYNNLVISCNMS